MKLLKSIYNWQDKYGDDIAVVTCILIAVCLVVKWAVEL